MAPSIASSCGARLAFSVLLLHVRLLGALPEGLASQLLGRCELHREDARGMTWGNFSKKGLRRKPSILEGLFNETELLRWKSEKVLEAYGNDTYRVDDGGVSLEGQGSRRILGMWRLDDFITEQSSIGNIFASDMLKGLFNDTFVAALRPPRTALLGYFRERPILTVGAAGSAAVAHEGHEETWQVLLQGSKAWFIGRGPPRGTPLGWDGWRKDGWAGWMDPCAALAKDRPLPPGVQLCVQQPGEVIYLPENAPHAVCYLEAFTLAVGAQGHTGRWPRLSKAALKGDVASVRRLAAQGGEALTATVLEERQTPLHCAARHGHAPVARALLEARAAADAVDARGQTALFVAAERGYVDVVKALAGSSKSLHWFDAEGRTTAFAVAAWGHVEVLQYMVEAHGLKWTEPTRQGGTPYFMAVSSGHVPIVDYLLTRGAEIDARDVLGFEPMHVAAMEGHAALASLLLRSRAAPGAVAGSGQTALELATSAGHSAVVEALQTWQEGSEGAAAQMEL